MLTSLKVQKAKGADPGEKRHNSEPPLGTAIRSRDSHQSPVPAGSHETGRARPRPICRKSRLHPGLQPRALRSVLAYSVRLAISHRELRNTTDSPGSRTPRELLGSGIPPRRAGQRHRPSIVGAAGGTSALGPGRDRAVTGGSCSPPVVGGGPAAHAPCTEACFTSVTTGELGFLFYPFVPLEAACHGRGWSARGGVPGPAGGQEESGKKELASLRSRPGILGLPGKPARPSRGQSGLGLRLPWSRGGAGARPVCRGGPRCQGLCGGRWRGSFIGATTPSPQGMLRFP